MVEVASRLCLVVWLEICYIYFEMNAILVFFFFFMYIAFVLKGKFKIFEGDRKSVV